LREIEFLGIELNMLAIISSTFLSLSLLTTLGCYIATTRATKLFTKNRKNTHFKYSLFS
jgi:hypothetical protein